MRNQRLTIVAVVVTGGAILLSSPAAHALPSFSRQTGFDCMTCHFSFPEMKSLGRDFKLNGYTTSLDDNLITKEGTSKTSGLSLLKAIPLSAGVVSAATYTMKSQPSTQNPTVEFPQQINLWLAGQVAPHFGTCLQVTYTSDNIFSFDSSDARYANTTKLFGRDLVFGLDVNNNPTFEDLWNSTPAWSFPFASADADVEPIASTLIDGTLGGQVVGAGPYAMWDNHLYALVEIYRSQQIGVAQPEPGAGPINIKYVAPYWRLAWQQNVDKNNYFEVGTYGIFLDSTPDSIGGPTDSYLDLAADVDYELMLSNGDSIIVRSTFIYETNDLGASFAQANAARAKHNLETWRLDANYHFGNKVTLTAGPFITWGTSDSVLYAAGALTGSANNSPNTSGYIVQAAWWPWQNLEIGVQYRGFLEFNGATSNYDGFGRNASDNNTLYVFVWVNI